MKSFTAQNLAEIINAKIIGSPTRMINSFAPISLAKHDQLTFFNKDGEVDTHAGIIICRAPLNVDLSLKTLLVVENPRLAFIKITELFSTKTEQAGVHHTAIIDEDVKLGINVSIGPFCHISNCTIGDNVTIKACTVIGTPGFGYELSGSHYVRFPQLGRVIIGNDVDIGANTCIDRGALTDTIIGEGTKIDNLVHIAHGAQIGKHCLIIAHAMVAGSVKIGDYAHISPNAAILNGKTVGNGATVGMSACVIKDVQHHDIVAGVPARSLRNDNR
jgi:UDP-3-O-[3-hydroxymyristoyl] glucosamine N-acyltransferase